MPKSGPTDKEWERRLREYGAGTFVFGRGQRPKKNSKYAVKLQKIESCPRHSRPLHRDLFGNRIVCVCGYHTEQGDTTLGSAAATSTATMTRPVQSDNLDPDLLQAMFESEMPDETVVTSAVPAPLGMEGDPAPLGTVVVAGPRPLGTVTGVKTIPKTAPPGTGGTEELEEGPEPLGMEGVPAPLGAVVVAGPRPLGTVTGVKAIPTTRPPVTSETEEGPEPLGMEGGPAPLGTVVVAGPRPLGTVAGVEAIPTTSERSTTPEDFSQATGEETPIQKSPSTAPRHESFSQRLPLGWANNMVYEDRIWAGKELFISKGQLKNNLPLWCYPPSPSPSNVNPRPGKYFHRKLLLWMPRRMWHVDFNCPNCEPRRSLRSKGVYKRIRLVLGLEEFYYLAGEYMECVSCAGTFISWDSRILSQLRDEIRALFPVILTLKYACDIAVVSLMRSRTLGNSPNALQHTIRELHSNAWLKRHILYLGDCERHKKGRAAQKLPAIPYPEVPPVHAVPGAAWFMACYVRDVWSRLDVLKAEITSVFGTVLKIDSTKKIAKKLQGIAAGNASWVTSVGNESGEVLQCVATTSESTLSLQPMADGLMDRFSNAEVDPPVLLYTDRDCCCNPGSLSKFQVMFSKWPGLIIKLDIWHYMRRLADGCTGESHPLYGTFMAQLSRCIFQWDKSDVNLLRSARRAVLVKSGIDQPSEDAVISTVTKADMAKHCRRRTRPHREMKEMLERVLVSLNTTTDSLGVPLLKDSMNAVWREQQRHLQCIQDPPGIQLYTLTGHEVVGGVRLPVFRCARGSTSLENFHLHLARFIPGTSANALNFQAYLLDGLGRWNANRAAEAISGSRNSADLLTFDVRLQQRANELAMSIHGQPVFENFRQPGEYTGELIGIEFLFHQCDLYLPTSQDEKLDGSIDEGFVDTPDDVDDLPIASEELDETVVMPEDFVTPGRAVVVAGPQPPGTDVTEPGSTDRDSAVPPPSSSRSESSYVVSREEDDVAVDSRGIPGWERVDRLAEALIYQGQHLFITSRQASIIQECYDDLLEYDKMALVYKSRYTDSPQQSRFGRKKESGYPGMQKVKTCFLTAGSPSLSPSDSRIVEAIIIRLCEHHKSSEMVEYEGKATWISNFKRVVSDYNEIKKRLQLNTHLMKGTTIALFHINETTVKTWFKQRTRIEEVQILLQGHRLPTASLCSPDALLPSRQLPALRPMPQHELLDMPQPEDRLGRAKIPVRRRKPSSTATSSSIYEPETMPPVPEMTPPDIPDVPVPDVPAPAPSLPSILTLTPDITVHPVVLPLPEITRPASIPTQQMTAPYLLAPATQQHALASPLTVPPAPEMSRTTAWRKRKQQQAEDERLGVEKRVYERKVYSCKTCQQPMTTTGHTQFRGQRYCPHEPGQVPVDQWLAVRRDAYAAAKAAKSAAASDTPPNV